VNLYAYAGSNPISFRDPFGLDTVRVGNDPDGVLQEAVDRCAGSQTDCGDAYRAADADTRVYLLNIGTLADSHQGGATSLHAYATPGDPSGNEFNFGPTVEITIDPTHFDQLSKDLLNAFGREVAYTIDDAVAHEFAGHAAGTLKIWEAGRMTPRGKWPGWCDQNCAKGVEDTYRVQRGLAPIWR
jgi:hypothetical protein